MICTHCHKEFNKFEGYRIHIMQPKRTDRLTIYQKPITIQKYIANISLCKDCYQTYFGLIWGCIWIRYTRRKIIKQV